MSSGNTEISLSTSASTLSCTSCNSASALSLAFSASSASLTAFGFLPLRLGATGCASAGVSSAISFCDGCADISSLNNDGDGSALILFFLTSKFSPSLPLTE